MKKRERCVIGGFKNELQVARLVVGRFCGRVRGSLEDWSGGVGW